MSEWQALQSLSHPGAASPLSLGLGPGLPGKAGLEAQGGPSRAPQSVHPGAEGQTTT